MANYHYLDGQTVNGPFDLTELEVLIKTGQLTEETFVIREGEADWLPIAKHPEIAPLLNSKLKRDAARERLQTILIHGAVFALALIIGFGINFMIDQGTESTEKSTSLRVQRGAEFYTQIKSISNQIRAARAVEDLIKAGEQVESEIGRLQQDYLGKEGEERQAINAQIHMLQTEIGFTGKLPPGAADHKSTTDKNSDIWTPVSDSDEAALRSEIEAKIKAARLKAESDEDKDDAEKQITELREIIASPDFLRLKGIVGQVKEDGITVNWEAQNASVVLRGYPNPEKLEWEAPLDLAVKPDGFLTFTGRFTGCRTKMQVVRFIKNFKSN